MLRVSLVVALIACLIAVSQAGCSSSYAASYDLSSTPLLSANSIVFEGGVYHLQPCGTVDATVCPYTSGQQLCYSVQTWELVGDGLGAPDQSTWSSLNGDWSQGAVSVNSDIANDYDQCNTDPDKNKVTITYKCNKGDNTVTVVTEPPSDKNGPCIFAFEVDSQVVCAASGGGTTSTGGGGGVTGSSGGNNGGDNSSSKKGLSGGWIFTIILLVTFTVYMLGGMAFMHYRKGQTGLDMIPNRAFWQELPGLVKDGCVYFVAKCRGLCAGGATSSSTSYATM